jgi:hypothetical protein
MPKMILPRTRTVLAALLIAVTTYSGCGGSGANFSANRAGSSSLAVSSSQITFPQVAVGTDATRTVTLTNTGAGSLTISGVTVTGTGFSVGGLAFPVTLSANQAANLTVTFKPSGAGSAHGTVSIVSNASSSPAAITLSGTGITYQLTVSPSNLSFGDVRLGQDVVLPVLLQNTGSASVTISAVTVTGSGFKVSAPAPPFTVAPGADSNLSATFTPTASAAYNGVLTVVSNAMDSPSVEILTGDGTSPANHSVTLTWIASTSSGISGYNLYRSETGSGPFMKINNALIDGTTYTDATVQSRTYYYAATSVDSRGEESGYSNTAQVTVP